MKKPLTRWTSLALMTLTALSSAQPAPLTPQDRIFGGMISTPPEGPEGAAYLAIFQSTKVWIAQPGANPDWRMPNTILAHAWYNPSGRALEPFKVVAFNGRPLTITPTSNPNVRNYYALKPPVTPDYEEWLNWYAYLNERTYPQYVAFDSDYGRPGTSLQYPPPYRMNTSGNLRIGNTPWTLEFAPAFPGEPAAEHATVSLYPSRTQERLTNLGDHFARPGSVLKNMPADRDLARMGGGWQAGTTQGYAGVSACNSKTVAFQGDKKILVKACTLVVTPVTITVVP